LVCYATNHAVNHAYHTWNMDVIVQRK